MSSLLCVVLSCVGRGIAIGRSSVQEVLPKCLNGFVIWTLILNGNGLEGLMRVTYKYIVTLFMASLSDLLTPGVGLQCSY